MSPFLVQGVFAKSFLLYFRLFFCFLMTIGTTGRPKGVTISHSALVVQSLAKIAIVGYGEDDVCLSTVIIWMLQPRYSIQMFETHAN